MNGFHQIQGMIFVIALTVSNCGPTCTNICVDGTTETQTEYQYWLFMISHPAHVPLASESISEAIDILRWSYFGPLLTLLIPRCNSFYSCQTCCTRPLTAILLFPCSVKRNSRSFRRNFLRLAVSTFRMTSRSLTDVRLL